MIDKIELKRLAQAAQTRGPWCSGSIGGIVTGYAVSEKRHARDGYLFVVPDRGDAEYLAAVDPDTVLDLLVEIERLGNTIRSLQ